MHALISPGLFAFGILTFVISSFYAIRYVRHGHMLLAIGCCGIALGTFANGAAILANYGRMPSLPGQKTIFDNDLTCRIIQPFTSLEERMFPGNTSESPDIGSLHLTLLVDRYCACGNSWSIGDFIIILSSILLGCMNVLFLQTRHVYALCYIIWRTICF